MTDNNRRANRGTQIHLYAVSNQTSAALPSAYNNAARHASSLQVSTSEIRLTPGITRRDEPLICGRLAHESRAIRGRVHAVVRFRALNHFFFTNRALLQYPE